MLAFNVAAADEMRDRLEKLLPQGRVPHVMTFHALAHRIVHPPRTCCSISRTRCELSAGTCRTSGDELMRYARQGRVGPRRHARLLQA